MSKHLQFMETCVLDKHISAGEHVAYKDGNQWKKGVVESISAVGAMMVRLVTAHIELVQAIFW